jgi:hypothetical protein
MSLIAIKAAYSSIAVMVLTVVGASTEAACLCASPSPTAAKNETSAAQTTDGPVASPPTTSWIADEFVATLLGESYWINQPVPVLLQSDELKLNLRARRPEPP